MEKFNTLEGIAAPMPLINIDTDMLIPKQFLKTIKRTGLGENLFFEMRYDQNGNQIIENYERYLPNIYETTTWSAIFFIVFGISLILAIDFYGRTKKVK